MDERRWQRIKEILDRATGLEPTAREPFIAECCAGDEDLHREVISLLAHDEPTRAAVDQPLFDVHARDPRLGQRLGPYRIVRLLGRGGMGTVYLARREDDYAQEVAIKLIQRGVDNAGRAARFHEERQILARLEHPLIARLLDGGTTEDGSPFLVMERVEGEPIDRFCDARRLDIDERLRLFGQVLEAVDFSHRHLVVHRDLKPGNILVTTEGIPRLIDFGIAKLLDPAAGAQAGILPRHRRLSPRYASPEQIRGQLLTPASDVFALGVLLYELLCGRHPFGRPQSETELEEMICETIPFRPSVAAGGFSTALDADAGMDAALARCTTPHALRRRLAGDLDAIAMTALAPRPQDRYRAAGPLRDDLEAHLAHRPVRARPGGPATRARKLVRRHPFAFTAAVLAVVAVLAILTALAYRTHAERQRDQAAAIEAFVGDLFRAADPDRADGEDLTVRELLDQGFEQLGSGLEGQPLVRSALLSVVGRVYQDLGDLERARSLHAEALELQRQHDPGADEVVARRANDLAVVLRQSGEAEPAEALYSEALGRLGGCSSEHPDALWTAGNLAWLRTERGDFERAEILIDCLLARHDARAGELDVPAWSGLLAKQGAFFFRRGRTAEAEKILRKVLTLREGHFGPLHTDTATAMNNLGRVLLERGAYEEARDLLGRALEVRRQLLGAEHPKTLNTRAHLAVAMAAETPER